MIRVIVESPFAGASAADMDRNLRYLRAALADCLARGEAPFASHALYTQPGVLRDHEPEERKLGIDAGFAWRASAERTVVYTDLGISPGMQAGIEHAKKIEQVVWFRTLPGWTKTSTGQQLEFERDFWQVKVGALLTLIENMGTHPRLPKRKVIDDVDLREALVREAYRIVNLRTNPALSAEQALAAFARLCVASNDVGPEAPLSEPEMVAAAALDVRDAEDRSFAQDVASAHERERQRNALEKRWTYGRTEVRDTGGEAAMSEAREHAREQVVIPPSLREPQSKATELLLHGWTPSPESVINRDSVAIDQALAVARRWGGIEGELHRVWVIDQMVRALTGERYEEWVRNYEEPEEDDDGNEIDTAYDWDTGVAP